MNVTEEREITSTIATTADLVLLLPNMLDITVGIETAQCSPIRSKERTLIISVLPSQWNLGAPDGWVHMQTSL